MPVPIPQETDPFATPGEWVFVNQQWLPILIGTLSYALNDRYWTGDQTERSQVIQSVLRLIDGIGELLPPETVREVTRFIEEMENDNDYENCEGDCMACNCGNAANVRYCEDTGLEYRGSDGVWYPVGVVADNVKPDDETPVGETPPPEVNQNACEKANALWDILFRYMEAIEETVPVFDFDPIPVTLEMSQMSAWWVANMVLQKPALPMKKIEAALYTLPQWFGANDSDFHDEIDYLQSNEGEVSADFICAMSNALSKDGRLTDADLEKAYSYEWATSRAGLDNMLGATLHHLISEDYMKEQAALYVRAAVHVCDCVGDTPVPPPPTEPAVGEFGFYPGIIVNALNLSTSPNEALAQTNPFGVKISEQHYETTELAGGNDSNGYLFVMWKATENVKEIGIDFIYQYTGTPSDGSQTTWFDAQFYASIGDANDFVEIGNGYTSNNDGTAWWGAASPSSPQHQIFPEVGTNFTDYRWLGLKIHFQLSRANNPAPLAEGIVKQIKLLAKASSGGDYRAQIVPGTFVPKAF